MRNPFTIVDLAQTIDFRLGLNGYTVDGRPIYRTIDPLLADHQGRIVKLMGDGALVEFGSVVDAVACAVAIQKGVAENQADSPTERRIVFRIGVNLGDVIHEVDGDLYGDGINIAARLQAVADPGGICISGTAYDHLQGKLDCDYEYLGERALKNMERPVRLYRALLEGTTARTASPRPALPDRPSIAVLPFNAMSADPEQDFFQAWPRGIAMIIDEERCIRCNLCVERCPTNCITMDRLELERFTPDGKVLLESYKDNVLGQVGQQAGMAVDR